MTQPLALVLYERLMPGSQLVNKLQDMKYRVQTIADPALLVATAEKTKPLLLVADMDSARDGIMTSIRALKQNAATNHIPILAFSREDTPELRGAAEKAGITLLVSETAIVNHFAQLLDQALEVH